MLHNGRQPKRKWNNTANVELGHVRYRMADLNIGSIIKRSEQTQQQNALKRDSYDLEQSIYSLSADAYDQVMICIHSVSA